VNDARRAPAQSLLEFALLLPLFVLVLFGFIDFSRLLFTDISLINGTRELARVAALPATTTATPTAAVNAFNNLTLVGGPLNNGATSVTFSNPGGFTINCTISASGCVLTLSTVRNTSTITTTLRTSSFTSLPYTFPSVPDPSAFTATANGDYVVVTTVGADLNGTVRICPLPVTTTCSLGAPSTASDGFIDVAVVYSFKFNPLFENRLTGAVNASVMRGWSTLRTSTRTYVE
jgi:Flp pilus assembly protein TadG